MNSVINTIQSRVNLKLQNHKVKVRFLIAGSFNTFVGLCTYPLLYLLLNPYGLHYLYILAINYAITILVAFSTNKYFVFKTTGNYLKEFTKFISFHLVHFFLNLLILPIMVEIIGMNPVIAQPIFAIVVILSSYFWYKNITFNYNEK
jgi:putative flippase GtrA